MIIGAIIIAIITFTVAVESESKTAWYIWALLVLICLVFSYTGFYGSYSEWERVWQLYKISKKWIIHKSYEWTMYLWWATRWTEWWVILDKFHFSTNDTDIFSSITKCTWKVSIEYKQWLIKPVYISTRYNIIWFKCL